MHQFRRWYYLHRSLEHADTLRRFNLKRLIEKREKDNEAIEKAKGGNNITMQDMINKKPVTPDYVTRTSIKK
jgi:hypothetical protein